MSRTNFKVEITIDDRGEKLGEITYTYSPPAHTVSKDGRHSVIIVKTEQEVASLVKSCKMIDHTDRFAKLYSHGKR